MASLLGVLRQPSASTGFGHALNIGTLVAAAETRDSPIEVWTSNLLESIYRSLCSLLKLAFYHPESCIKQNHCRTSLRQPSLFPACN